MRGSKPIGFILFYECFSVYSGKRGIYIPGVYIIPEHRHQGYGVRLMRYGAQRALEQGCEFINGIVESNNAKANAIYKKLGAEIVPDWSYCKLPLKPG